ncbi:phosphoenolpyruvate carboxykinase (GTP) [Tessaracoccus sp. MC1679]|uniref:phosphoenolpyruvate carboxykinase (GTP) n=1 Tax=Tessaracoccus sp. MC1679 TaxID=2760313 RepID=UPI001601A8C0|nr:phosphoenolpyruvate carboxykinase (GTP) [Tessaracoccus sp. MC1679]MBB1515230.1 phosphoenolpyruvate carboxykinase (GTP) [Tessaracoccus sp. MC1679]
MSTATETRQRTRTDLPATGVAPTHPKLLAWLDQVVRLCKPEAIHYCDGSDAEYDALVGQLEAKGTVVRLNETLKPNSVLARTDPDDVARVEDQTFICSKDERNAGPTNNWMDPDQMKRIMTPLFDGCMAGRIMYVMPFCMGSMDAEDPKYGVEISDSAYVAISMKIMTRMGAETLARMEETNADFVPALHSVGMPLVDGQEDVPWPCNEIKYIVHFTDERLIWSYGSGYGGNSLLGKKCYALRIASAMARDEGWLAEHMLILKLISPEGRAYHIAAAFPSACGKTNLAMLDPTIPGWTVETLGDDIAWLRFGADGRLYATNPETGFFGVAPGTSHDTNPNAMLSLEGGNTIFTNVALTPEGDVWWEGMTKEPPAVLTDWKGREWRAGTGPVGGRPNEKAAHPNSRFCTPIDQCPILSEDYHSPQGVPLDAIVFGGRRENTIPLVMQSRSWQHGVFMGATCSSETTAASSGAVGVLRRDPMAMLPFIGYHVADYVQHWISIGRHADEALLPKVFYVNWFRRDTDGRFMWPGFGENSRVLKWIAQRVDGLTEAVETPIGFLPADGSLDVDGLAIDENDLREVVSYKESEWRDEVPRIGRWFDTFGWRLPRELVDELRTLETAFGRTPTEV